jgi:hypothetical protein
MPVFMALNYNKFHKTRPQIGLEKKEEDRNKIRSGGMGGENTSWVTAS